MTKIPVFPSVEYERWVARLESIGVVKPGASRRTQQKYIKEFAAVLSRPGGYTPKIVDEDMADTLRHGGGQMLNPKVFKVGRKNIAFFPTFEGGSVRVYKNRVTVFTPSGTTTYVKGAYSADTSIPRKIEKFLKPRGEQTPFMRSDMIKGGDQFFSGPDGFYDDPESVLDEYEREQETASLGKPDSPPDARKRYAEFMGRMNKGILFALDAPAIKAQKKTLEQRKKISEDRKANPPKWKL